MWVSKWVLVLATVGLGLPVPTRIKQSAGQANVFPFKKVRRFVSTGEQVCQTNESSAVSIFLLLVSPFRAGDHSRSFSSSLKLVSIPGFRACHSQDTSS